MDTSKNVMETGRSMAKEQQKLRQMKSPISRQTMPTRMRIEEYVEMGKTKQISSQDKLLFSSLGIGRARAEADNNHNIQRVLLDKEYLEFQRKCLTVNVNSAVGGKQKGDVGGKQKGSGCLKFQESASRSRGVVISDVGSNRKGKGSMKLNESASGSPGRVKSDVGGKLKGKSCLKLNETPSRSAVVNLVIPDILKRKRENVFVAVKIG